MSTRASQHEAVVESREQLSPHLVRLVLGGLTEFTSTGIPDEWVGLIVPGQFQSRYYTVRRFESGRLTLDVVVHDSGLVTQWAARDCVGETVTITEPKGSFEPPEPSSWLILMGDLTAMPAMARIAETTQINHVAIYAETADDLPGYLPDGAIMLPTGPSSGLARAVEALDWPDGDGYFWMAGESAQMRAIRKHLMRERQLPADRYNVMGYWRDGKRQPRPVDPGPQYARG